MQTEHFLFEFIARYTIVTDACWSVADREQVASTLRRLVDKRQISEWRHGTGLRYWTAKASRPLSDRSLIRSLGILYFCQDSTSRSLVTKQELAACFPDLFRHGLPAGHYIDRNPASLCLGLVRVDPGQARINRIVSRTAQLVHSYRQRSGFRQLIDQGQFELTWIVPTIPKQRRLAHALNFVKASGIRARVCAIPELLDVIMPIQV